MPEGKPAGVRCVQLTADNRCQLFGLPTRPLVCNRLRPMPEMCRDSADEALAWLTWLEQVTAPTDALTLFRLDGDPAGIDSRDASLTVSDSNTPLTPR
jgi:hypothetical protein